MSDLFGFDNKVSETIANYEKEVEQTEAMLHLTGFVAAITQILIDKGIATNEEIQELETNIINTGFKNRVDELKQAKEDIERYKNNPKELYTDAADLLEKRGETDVAEALKFMSGLFSGDGSIFDNNGN